MQRSRSVKLMNTGYPMIRSTKIEASKVSIRFVKAKDMVAQQQKRFMEQASFLAKMAHIKQSGKKIEVSRKIEAWLEDFVDEQYAMGKTFKMMKSKSVD